MKKKSKIFITVIGGVAYPVEATLPLGYEVEIVNFDDIDETGEFPSRQAFDYYLGTGLYTDRRDTQAIPKSYKRA